MYNFSGSQFSLQLPVNKCQIHDFCFFNGWQHNLPTVKGSRSGCIWLVNLESGCFAEMWQMPGLFGTFAVLLQLFYRSAFALFPVFLGFFFFYILLNKYHFWLKKKNWAEKKFLAEKKTSALLPQPTASNFKTWEFVTDIVVSGISPL